MPAWNKKDQRQYEAIKEQQLEGGKDEDDAQEVAARTVNKRRRQEGQTPNTTTQGTGNPNTDLEQRTVDELRNLASKLEIANRSKLTEKKDLIRAIRKTRN